MRVTSGKYKGKRLLVGSGSGIRPTSDMVKQAIFNVLQFKTDVNSVLDLFSGSGALGIEALSRGSENAVFNDNNRESIRLLRKNLENIGTESAQIYCMDYISLCNMLSGSGQKFDVIFIDPPYEGGMGVKAVAASLKLIADGGIIVHEYQYSASIAMEYNDIPLKSVDTKRYGSTAVDFIYV